MIEEVKELNTLIIVELRIHNRVDAEKEKTKQGN